MICCFLVGGIGQRLWPLSRQNVPKQFLSLVTPNQSLLQESYLRVADFIPSQKIFFVGLQQPTKIQQQLAEINIILPKENFINEPCSRNTAAAILLFLRNLPQKYYNEPIVILPCDHYIKEKDKFIQYLKQAEALANQNEFVVFGIKPTCAETGYGYIEVAKQNTEKMSVLSFHEKPNLETAQEYIKKDTFYWNSGMFIANTTTFLQAFKTTAPELYAALPEGTNKQKQEEIYKNLPSISFDYAVLEKTKNLVACELNLSWSDLGGWRSIYQTLPKDKNQNAIVGAPLVEETKNSLLFNDKRLVVSYGMENMILIDTPDVLFVCNMAKLDSVKELIEKIKKIKPNCYFMSTEEVRPWGWFQELFCDQQVKIKEICILPEKRLSLQRHKHREEHWIIQQGIARITNGEIESTCQEGDYIFIPQEQIHRIENIGSIDCKFIEVQRGSYLGEDDIERLEDDFKRL